MPYRPPGFDPDADEFGHIKPGKHGAAVESLELRYGGESGEPYVAWAFAIIEGEFKNRRVWNNTTLQEKGINMPTGFYKSVIAALGERGEACVEKIQGEEWDNEETMTEWISGHVCGRLVTIAVANRTYQGKPQNDVVGIKTYEGETPQLDTEELAATAGSEPPKEGKRRGGGAPKGKGTAKSDVEDF